MAAGGRKTNKSAQLPKNEIRVQIQHKSISALIDTGAIRSLISDKMARNLHLEILPLQPGDNRRLVTANGSLMKVIGRTSVELKINGLTITYDFLILPNITQDLILGIDFLTDNKAKINFVDKTISFLDDWTGTVILEHYRSATNMVCLIQQCILPPHSETIIPLCVK